MVEEPLTEVTADAFDVLDVADATDFATDGDDFTDFFSDTTDLADSTAFADCTDVCEFFKTSEFLGVSVGSIVTSWPSRSSVTSDTSRSIVVSRNLNDRTELALDSAGVGGWANTDIDGLLVE